MDKNLQHRYYLYTALFFILLGAVWYLFFSPNSTIVILLGAIVLDNIVKYFHFKKKTHDSEYPDYKTYFLFAVIFFLIGISYSIFDDDGYKIISLLFFSAIGVVYLLIGLNSRCKYQLNKSDQ